MKNSKISANVILDSKYKEHRITTLEINIPKFILAEFNTHRRISKSFQSSRAVPVGTQLKRIISEPFIPDVFTENISGMQGGDKIAGKKSTILRYLWILNGWMNIIFSYVFIKLGVHKQYSNRFCELHTYVKGVITSTEWDNMFQQRISDGAQPEFKELATKIKESIKNSLPDVLYTGDLHLPYIRDGELDREDFSTLAKMSIARCAGVSYRKLEMDKEKNLKLYNVLVESNPKHLSPLEHVAIANSGNFANFVGFQSIRNKLGY